MDTKKYQLYVCCVLARKDLHAGTFILHNRSYMFNMAMFLFFIFTLCYFEYLEKTVVGHQPNLCNCYLIAYCSFSIKRNGTCVSTIFVPTSNLLYTFFKLYIDQYFHNSWEIFFRSSWESDHFYQLMYFRNNRKK